LPQRFKISFSLAIGGHRLIGKLALIRLEAVRGIIKAGMDYPAISTTGVEATRSFFFQQRYFCARKTML
jgi:hypothetical protein